MTKITEQIFDPNAAYFSETPVGRRLYPNVLSSYDDPNYRNLFDFFGRLIGKALFEGVLLKSTFATFFLKHMLNKTNTVDDLKALDSQLYDNLM